MIFYLGVHRPHWLATAGVPLFVSRRVLAGRKSLPSAIAPWCLDSGGFSELSMYGEWRTPAEQYVEEARRYQAEIGSLDWCAPQDWMCEPWIVERTGLSVEEHQSRTIASVIELREAGLPVIPVLQGWEFADYLCHVEQYERAGFDLKAEPVVGLGSVCRRQGTREAESIIRWIASLGIQLHGFGVKADGLKRVAPVLHSADSMAWSYHARRRDPLADCEHRNCANCLDYALMWRDGVLAKGGRDG